MHTQTRHIEIHQLDLRYDHTRVYKKRVVNRLYRSLEQFGQLTPVLVTPGEGNQFILIDGYFCVKAIARIQILLRLPPKWMTKYSYAKVSEKTPLAIPCQIKNNTQLTPPPLQYN